MKIIPQEVVKFPSISNQMRILDVSINQIDEIPAVITTPFIVEYFEKSAKITKNVSFVVLRNGW